MCQIKRHLRNITTRCMILDRMQVLDKPAIKKGLLDKWGNLNIHWV